MKEFFVMLNHPNNNIGYVPMTDENDDMAKFDNEIEANIAAENSVLGSEFGWEVFRIGHGL